MRIHRNAKGFTLVEVTIILLVLTILASIMLPQLGNFNRLARFVKTDEDVQVLCTALKKMLDEVKAELAVPAAAYEVCHSFVDEPPTNGESYYYLRVTQMNGQMAWSSPIWVRRGEE